MPRPLLRSGPLLFLGALLLLAGCEGRGTPPDLPAGRFTAYVEGVVSDTLTGTAHYRRSDGAITGLELGPRDGPGLSIELEPHPPELRTYEVIEPELFRLDRPESPPGLLAFLTLEDATFEAVDGTLELTYVGEGQIGATFELRMEGTFENGGVDDASVAVSGALNAPSER